MIQRECVAREGCYFMKFNITSPPREPIVVEVDGPNDVTGAYIVLSPHCFPPTGAQFNYTALYWANNIKSFHFNEPFVLMQHSK